MESNQPMFPTSIQEYKELQEYLRHLKETLEQNDPNNMTPEDLNQYSNILNAIESSLTLAELEIIDDVCTVRDARKILEIIFNKSIL